jgi:hypothetical protein
MYGIVKSTYERASILQNNLNGWPWFVENNMSICENEAVLFYNEAGPVRGRHGLACVIVTNTEVLDLKYDMGSIL